MPDRDRLERLKRLRRLKEQRGHIDPPMQDLSGSSRASGAPPQEGASFPYVEGEPLTNVARSIGNIPGDVGRVIGRTAEAAASPVETTMNVKSLIDQVPYEIIRKGVNAVTGKETLPEFPSDVLYTPRPGAGEAFLSEAKRRYVDELPKTFTEEPAQSAMDVMGIASPVTRAARSAGAAQALQRFNPGIAPLTAIGRAARKGASAVKGAGEEALVASAEALTGTGKNPRYAYDIGRRLDPEQSGAFSAMRRSGGSGMERIRNTAIEAVKDYKGRETARYSEGLEDLIKKPGVMERANPFELGRALDKVKASVVEDLQRFRVDPRGRRNLLEDIGESERMRAGREVFIDPETGLPQQMPPKGGISNNPKSIQNELGIDVIDPATGEALTQAESGMRRFLKRYRKTQERPGRARSKDMSETLDLDFENSTIGSGGQRALIDKISREILGQETTHLRDLKSLLERIDSHIDEASLVDPSTRSNAFVVSMRQKVRKVLSDHVKGYDEIAKPYEEMRKFNSDFGRHFSLDSLDETSLQKFADALTGKLSRESRERLLGELALNSDKAKTLASQIAGINLSETFGRGLIGRSVGTALVTGGPTLAAGLALGGLPGPALAAALGGVTTFMASSPRVMGKFLHALGAADGHVQNVVKILTDLKKAADMQGLVTDGLTWGEIINNLTEQPDRNRFLQNVGRNLRGTQAQVDRSTRTRRPLN